MRPADVLANHRGFEIKIHFLKLKFAFIQCKIQKENYNKDFNFSTEFYTMYSLSAGKPVENLVESV